MSTAGFTTNESSHVLLVSVHNTIYPINEQVLHRVFDPYGYVEKIDILQSSQLLQAVVQFDLCQNAAWAKSQLQGRYIYVGCCQLDIQFYKSFGNEIAADLDFIKHELQRMIIITDRMQDTVKRMISSIQKTAHTVSKSSESTSSISVIPPTLPPTAAASSTTPSSPSDRTRPEVAQPVLASIPIPPCVAGSSKTSATPGTYTSTLPPNLEPHFSSVENKSAPNPFNEALHLTVDGFKKVCTEVIDSGSMEFTIKSGSPMSTQIQPGTHSFGVVLFAVLCMGPTLHPSFPKEQKWAAANYKHKLFGLMLERNGRKAFEKVVFIFDPGGVLRLSKPVSMKKHSCFSHRVQFDKKDSFYIIFFQEQMKYEQFCVADLHGHLYQCFHTKFQLRKMARCLGTEMPTL